MRPPLSLGVLVSGEGSTLDGLAAALAAETDRVRIALVVCDRAGAPALERARRRGLATSLRPYSPTDIDGWSAGLTADLDSRHVDLVVLAGFLSILPPGWVDRWTGRAINLHPSLLPRFGGRGMHGRRVHEAVLAAGDRETGVTVHLVTGDVDGGPPVAHERIPVLPGDTPESLRDRLRPVEVRLLASTVRRFADGDLPLPYPGGDERA
ncbi:MAG: phosphoribosylglycinamide formyltransferase, partial [Thermoplasmata archaeon]